MVSCRSRCRSWRRNSASGQHHYLTPLFSTNLRSAAEQRHHDVGDCRGGPEIVLGWLSPVDEIVARWRFRPAVRPRQSQSVFPGFHFHCVCLGNAPCQVAPRASLTNGLLYQEGRQITQGRQVNPATRCILTGPPRMAQRLKRVSRGRAVRIEV